MSENRRQHFIPEFFLAGFTESGARECLLHVLDQETGRQWRVRPGEIAHQRDFYRIEVADVDPNLFEKTFGAFEGQVAEVVRNLVVSQQPPDGDAFSNLMFFIALMAVRIPRRRAHMSRHVDEIAKAVMRMTVATPERWEATRRRMRADGVAGPAEMSYEEAKALFESDDFSVDYPRTWHVGVLHDSAKTIFPYLADRQWTYFVADDEAGDFICSDYPVGLVWSSGETSGFFPPGFAVSETEVSMPLTRRWAMLGRFEREGGVYRATRTTVAAINSRTGMSAQQLYSAKADFVLTKRGGDIGTTADLLAWIAQRKPQPPPSA